VANKRDHHKLPVFYLRGFTEPGTSFVWVFQRGRPFSSGAKAGRDNPARTGIYKTAVERDRNTVVRFDGTRDFNTIEDQHQVIESRAASALRTIRRKELVGASEKDALARFIGALWRRTADRSQKARSFLDGQIAEAERAARMLADAGNFRGARLLFAVIDYLRAPTGEKYVVAGTEPTPLEQMHRGFMDMNWLFGVAPTGSHFVTCDTPVLFSAADGLRNSPLIVPFARDLAVLATWDEVTDLAFAPLSLAQVADINALVARAARTEVYSSLPDETVWTKLMPESTTNA
jgi:hypothetical protein